MKKRSLLIFTAFMLLSGGLLAADAVIKVSRNLDVPSFVGWDNARIIIVLKNNVKVDHARDKMSTQALANYAGFDPLLNRFAVTESRPQFAGADRKAGGEVLARHYKVTIGNRTVEQAKAAFERNPKVERVELIGIHTMFATPNDTYYDNPPSTFPYDQWHYWDSKSIDADLAWNSNTGDATVVVGILDSGTRYFHLDLGGNSALWGPDNPFTGGNIFINPGETAGDGIDNDGNGYIDDVIGYDFVERTNQFSGVKCIDQDCGGKDNDPDDGDGHGTHTAGTVGAITNNGRSVAGVAGGFSDGTTTGAGNGVKIVPCRMGFHAKYRGQTIGIVLMDAAAEAMYYMAGLVDAGINVAAINCSWGSSNSGGLGAAADFLLSRDVVIVVAAGNSNSTSTSYLSSRGDCLDVAATDRNGNGASFTNYGSWVDVAAPGVDIMSTYANPDDANLNNHYVALLSGTSMSAPHVVGILALLESCNPSLSGPDKFNLVVNNTTVYSDSRDLGSGIANAALALAAATCATCAETTPAADFSGLPVIGDAPLTVNFSDLSLNNPSSWSWNFGDGGISTAQNPNYTYSTAGTYTVALAASNCAGSDVITKVNYITVTQPPVPPAAQFTGTPTSGCAPLAVTFTDQSTGDVTSWSWDFGDGNTSTVQSPSHSYVSGGSFTVSLTAMGPGGTDTNTKTNYISVSVAPAAGFAGTPTSGDAPLTVVFTDQSTNASSWSWDFGDGGTSTIQNPSYIYDTAGTYSVTQTVTNPCGSDQLVQTNYITVTQPLIPPTAQFTGTPTSGCAPLAVAFTDQSTGDVTSWSWNFGDGNTSTVQNPSHSYATGGSFTVSLAATGPGGTDTNTKTNYISVSGAPTADFSGTPTTGIEPLTVNFSDLSSGSPTGWSWDFGDGGTSVVQNPSHTYSVAGTYAVSLTASNACGSNQAVKTNYITVNPCVIPVAGFGGTPTSGDAPLTVVFTDQSTNADSWSWDFGDGGTSTIQNPSYIYDTAGTYSVTQTVTNPCGSDQLVQTNYITVTQPAIPPTAQFSGTPTSGCAPLAVTFTDQSTGDVTSWSWNFGDGNTSTVQNPSHSYATGGSFTVSLAASGPGGSDTNTANNYITVFVTPVADFSGSPILGDVPLTVDFTDLSTNNPDAWSWDFGDGGTSFAQNPSYTYNTAGNYTVSLTASNCAGSNVITLLNYITPTAAPAAAMYVMSIELEFIEFDDGGGFGQATVTITDLNEEPVVNAIVYGIFNAPDTVTKSGITDDDGTILIMSNSTMSPPSDWCFEASNVTHDSYTYDATLNAATQSCESGPVFSAKGSATSVVPESYGLGQNYPNPFNPSTEISFTLPEAMYITLEVFNVTGQRIATVAVGSFSSGEHTVTWNAERYSSGVYFYRLTRPDLVQTKKMLLLK